MFLAFNVPSILQYILGMLKIIIFVNLEILL